MKRAACFRFTWLMLVLSWLIMSAGVQAGKHSLPASHVYITREGSGPDKGASAWLIKTFIDKRAVFDVRPSGADVSDGFAFDVPESPFRRTHLYSTYETLMHEYQVKNSRAERIRAIVHDIEVNAWRTPISEETTVIRNMVTHIQRTYGANPVKITCYIAFFEWLYSRMQDAILPEELLLPSAVLVQCDGK